MMDDGRQSHSPVVPENPPNNARERAAEAGEERAGLDPMSWTLQERRLPWRSCPTKETAAEINRGVQGRGHPARPGRGETSRPCCTRLGFDGIGVAGVSGTGAG